MIPIQIVVAVGILAIILAISCKKFIPRCFLVGVGILGFSCYYVMDNYEALHTSIPMTFEVIDVCSTDGNAKFSIMELDRNDGLSSSKTLEITDETEEENLDMFLSENFASRCILIESSDWVFSKKFESSDYTYEDYLSAYRDWKDNGKLPKPYTRVELGKIVHLKFD